MPEAEEVLDAYLAAWNERDDHARLSHLERCWSDEGTFCDPLIPEIVHGRKQMSDAIGEMCAEYVRPGQRFVRRTEIQEHHDVLRYVWGLLDEDGRELRRGEDVITRGADGRIANLVMFLGDLKELDGTVSPA